MTISRVRRRYQGAFWPTLVLVWAAVVVGLSYLGYRHGTPTDREQTAIAAARSTAQTALADVAVAAAGPDVVRVLDADPDGATGCRITPVRPGLRYRRTLDLYLPPADVAALMQRIAARLPPRYGAAAVGLPDTPELIADAGNFVAVRAVVLASGRVRVTADTGCRAGAGASGAIRPIAGPAARAPVRAMLDAIGRSAQRWRSGSVGCADRPALTTVEATAGPPTSGQPAVASVLPPSARHFPAEGAEPEAYAYPDGQSGVVVLVGAGSLRVIATTGC